MREMWECNTILQLLIGSPLVAQCVVERLHERKMINYYYCPICGEQYEDYAPGDVCPNDGALIEYTGDNDPNVVDD